MTPENTPHKENDPLRGKRVLIVDDDICNVFCFEETLKHLSNRNNLNLTIFTAHSGKEALKLLESGETIDLLVTDCNMGEKSGPRLIGDIKALSLKKGFEYLASMAIIMASARFYADSAEKQAQEYGADTGFAKPVNPKIVFEKAREIFRSRLQKAT
jgi:CheY-like chemotaxis protein